MSSYDELLKQVESLKLENSNLHRELQDNSSHLCQLEEDASVVKDVFSRVQDDGDGEYSYGGEEEEAVRREHMAVADGLDTSNFEEESDQSDSRLESESCKSWVAGSNSRGHERSQSPEPAIGSHGDPEKEILTSLQQLEHERTSLVHELKNEDKNRKWYYDQIEMIQRKIRSLPITDNYGKQQPGLTRKHLDFEISRLRETMHKCFGTNEHVAQRKECRVQNIRQLDVEIAGLQQEKSQLDQSRQQHRLDPHTDSTQTYGDEDDHITMATQTKDDDQNWDSESQETVVGQQNISAMYHGAWPIGGKDMSHDREGSLPSLGHQDVASVMSFNSANTSSTQSSGGLQGRRQQQQQPLQQQQQGHHIPQQQQQQHQPNMQQPTPPMGSKVEMVYSLLSMLGTHDKDDMSRTLLAMSSSQDSCIAMRQSGCMPLLIQLLHGSDKDSALLGNTRGSKPARARAAAAMHNIVHSHPDDKRGRREARVLRLLEQIRAHCDQLRDTHTDEDGNGITDRRATSEMDHHPGPAIATLMKLSFDEEHRHAICTLDIMMRSILGHMLPEAMVCYLENYSADKFAQTFLGEFDTPEAIWNTEMRRMMIEKIAAHLIDFSPRLMSNTRALYQYCPIPLVNYPQLEDELFCNIYYLKHLCDTKRFPDWPIKDPVRLLKDILEAWKKEVEKKAPTMSLDDAYEVLKLSTGTGGHEEAKIRKAYFRLAQKYHPDKNPEGRDMFEKVNKAYEFLCSKSRTSDGPNPDNIVLILKAQCILFSRYSEELHPYKYAGYPMLIKTIRMETNDDQLFSKSAPLLAAASELAYHTVNCSALNAEELRRENGIQVLQDAFSRCVNVLSLSSKPEELSVQVCTHIVRCYSVAAQFKGCREKIQECPAIIKDLCRILYYKNVPKLCSVIAECVCAFCVDFWLQTHLFQSGVLWHLLLYLFQYDYTLEEGGVEKSGESNQQEVSNQLARLCIFACARLGGYYIGESENSTPDNPAVKKSLSAMLTPYLARKLAHENPSDLLKVLNSNTENPYLIWDNATRMQLGEFLGDQQLQMIRTGECDPDFGGMFVFDVHAKELIVGEIFVRAYNEQPTFPLENAKGFTIDLLDFLGSQAQYLHSLLMLQQSKQQSPDGQGSTQLSRLGQVEMALEALRNVIRNNPGVEIQCIGHFKLLFCLLRLDDCAKLQQYALEVINLVSANHECVKDIAASEVQAYLLLAIQLLQGCRVLTLETLAALMSSTKVVKEAITKGATVYLLDLFCNATNPAVREKTAELFAKMLADKLVGPRVRIILGKFLPGIFMDAMRDSAEASVHMFEGTHENPELIWNDESREKVSSEVRSMKDTHYRAQRDDPDLKWTLPEEYNVIYGNVTGEIIVGGVFLRLFIANPGWVLRKPKEFLTELLELWSQLVSSTDPDGEMLETITTAIICLFTAQSTLADQVPQLGYIPKVFTAMRDRNNAIPKSAVQICHQLANSEVCIRAMAQVECIGPMKVGMKLRRDAIALAAEALSKMFDKGEEELVSQALKTEMVQYLLKLLEAGLEALDNPASTKAQIVKALKAMQRSLLYAEQIGAILDSSPVWREYKDQKHDLFISDTQIAGYLTGPTGPSVAGYLTAGTRSTMPDKPPPLDPGHQDDQVH